MIERQTIDKIYERADIVEIISEFVALKKRGVNYLGHCPFHNERTPSFTVSPSKGIFKCFGCGKSGNAVGFLMEHEGFSYPEALKFLAKKYGIQIEETVVTDEQIAEQNKREKLLSLTNVAAKWYYDSLHKTPEGNSVGKAYFRERGFTDSIIDKFGLGYSPESRTAFVDFARKQGFPTELLIESGLAVESSGKIYDRFFQRVIFPIHSLSGQVLGFGGRTLLNDKNIPKYLNSPETLLYQKSKILYGIFQARKAIVQNDCCFLVEGYTDVLSMAQCGIENVVASSGTALTIEQIRLIKRFTNNLTVLYDGDYAGIKASLRGIDMILAEDMNVKVCFLPNGEDPDSFSRKLSDKEFSEFITKNQTDFIRFKAQLMLDEAAGDPIKKTKLIINIVQSIAQIPSEISRSVYIKECSRMFEISEDVLLQAINKELRKKNQGSANTEIIKYPSSDEIKGEKITKPVAIFVENNTLEVSERDLIRFLLEYGDRVVFSQKNPENPDDILPITVAEFIVDELEKDDFVPLDSVWNTVFVLFSEAVRKNKPLSSVYFINHPNIQISQKVVDLLAKRYPLSRFWEEYFFDRDDSELQLAKGVQKVVNEYKWRRIKDVQEKLTAKLADSSVTTREIELIMNRLAAINTLKNELAAKLGEKPIL